jgi:hypothetical protein
LSDRSLIQFIAMARTQWWLADAEGARRRLDPGGILMGRSPECDLVLRDPKASRSQALVYLDSDALRLVVLGRGRTLVDGRRVEREVKLEPGQVIDVPGSTFRVVTSEEPEPEESGVGWVLELPGGGFFGITSGAFRVGGHPEDDLLLDGWPSRAFVLRTTVGRLHMIANATLHVGDREVHEGELLALTAGNRIAFGDQVLRVVTGGDFGHGSTVGTDGDPCAPVGQVVRLEFLPRGGRLRLRSAGREQSVYLPGQRCDLMAVLLRPPPPFAPGDLLEDELVLSRVWPTQTRGRVDLNTLIYRLRRDLVAAGIDATALIQRASGGGAIRVALAPNATIEVR